MRITALHVTNFKRIRDVQITPGADRTIILLGGKNKQGKSSTLDALTAAFGGKKTLPPDPVRHGADAAEIRVELDGGELTVRRIIQPDGESVLEVRDRLGTVKSPQAALDKLIGARFLDPLQFLALPGKEQRAQLMRIIGEADRIATLDGKRERAFAKRTEVGRDLTKAEGELARLPVVDVGTPIDVTAVAEEQRTLSEQQRQADALAAKACTAEQTRNAVSADLVRIKAKISELKRSLDELQKAEDMASSELAAMDSELVGAKLDADKAAAAWQEAAARREQLDADLARADAHNRAIYAAEAQNKRRGEAASAVAKLKEERDAITKMIAVIDERKAEILAASKLPIEGLGIDADGITLEGVPLAQASGAERFRVALALAIAASQGLDDVWIRDAAILDEDHLKLIAEQAIAAGKRPWLELVGTREPGVIVISDGTGKLDESEAA